MDIQLSEKFIDDQLAKANGDFLKVYLYILRHAGAGPDCESIADALNMTEKDVQRAIAYWKKEGVLDAAPDAVSGAVPDAAPKKEQGEMPEKREVDITRLSEDDEFRALLHALQNYMSRRFTPRDAEAIGYMYDQLGFSAELIEYLFELCKQKGKTSIRYIEKVALGWHDKGIRTIDDARTDTTIFAAEIESIRKHMGISSRDLAKRELDYIDRWLRTWKMPVDIIEEACDRTVISAGKASFAYANSILKNWYELGLRTLKQIEEHDKEYIEDVHTRAVPAAKGRTNSFHNFDERKEGKNKGLDADVMDKFNDLFE